MTVIVLSLVGLMVLVVTIAPPDRGPGMAWSARTPTPAPPSAADGPGRVRRLGDAVGGPGREGQTVEAELGDRVEMIVDGDALDSVALGDLSMKSVEPGVPARFELLADTAGAYPVVLVNENRRIGTLEVR